MILFPLEEGSTIIISLEDITVVDGDLTEGIAEDSIMGITRDIMTEYLMPHRTIGTEDLL